MPRARFLLIALIALAALVATPRAGRASLALPTVTSDMVDADGTSVAGATVAAGTQVRAAATVAGAAGAPSGSVTFAEYDGSDCGGASTDAWTAALATALQPQSHTIDISNAGGWDSATAWNANGVDQFQTNWFGGLFAGTDNAFFSASSMAWRFAGLPVPADATVTRAYLLLRIRKSRPSIPAEGVWTWKTVLATDTRSGADFAGENRTAFLARFNMLGARWEMPLSSAVLDPFGTNDGAAYAQSPDVAPLIVSRIGDPGWSAGGDVVVGIINNGTVGIAEAEVVDQPDYVRLHVEWSAPEAVGVGETPAFAPAAGVHSYRAHYGGDGAYAAADGPCMTLAAAAPVGGVAQIVGVDSVAPPGGAGDRPGAWGFIAVTAVIAVALAILVRSGRRVD